ncbi:hypothetical protein L1887_14732 [Cichorium endivia]|nr:hypothetical protein L1887_14732 [Cichorium endivia]
MGTIWYTPILDPYSKGYFDLNDKDLSFQGPEAGAPLVSHPDVGKIAFTGSSATGSKIMNAAAENVNVFPINNKTTTFNL